MKRNDEAAQRPTTETGRSDTVHTFDDQPAPADRATTDDRIPTEDRTTTDDRTPTDDRIPTEGTTAEGTTADDRVPTDRATAADRPPSDGGPSGGGAVAAAAGTGEVIAIRGGARKGQGRLVKGARRTRRPPRDAGAAVPGARGSGGAGRAKVTLRGPAELVDALPYLLGYYPDDSIVLLALHGSGHRLGGRVRTVIPVDSGSWRETAEEVASCLVAGSRRRGGRPDAIVVYLCQDSPPTETSVQTMERLRPLAQLLRTECGKLDVPVVETLCISDGRYWSYSCPGGSCCPPEGTVMKRDPASPMAAAATYAGIRVQGSLRDLERRITPLDGPVATRQVQAFDATAADLLPRMLGGPEQAAAVRAETLRLATRLLSRLRRGAEGGRDPGACDARDDELLTSREAAALVLGLQDGEARDQALEWVEGGQVHEAVRLWRALARRCVHAWEGHAAAPLTLAGWAAWMTGDETQARVAFGQAVTVDPSCVLAQMLHHAINEGLDPQLLRQNVRDRRMARTA